MMLNSVSDTGILGKKIRVLLLGVGPKTFRLLARMLAIGKCQTSLELVIGRS